MIVALQCRKEATKDNVENQLGIVRVSALHYRRCITPISLEKKSSPWSPSQAGGSAPMVALLKGDTQEQAPPDENLVSAGLSVSSYEGHPHLAGPV